MMESPKGGNLGDPRGTEMESDMVNNECPYMSNLEMEKGLIKSLDG
jgi:hypothetical protein